MQQYMTLDEYNKVNGLGGNTALTSQEQPQQPAAPEEGFMDTYGIYKSGQDGSILGTAKSLAESKLKAFVASNTGSNYANRKFEEAYKRTEAEQAKLGMVGNVAAGMVGYAPAIAAGIANPLLGGAAAGMISTGDALLAQRENNQALDINKAAKAGAQSAAFDIATGGAAGRIKTVLGASAPALKKTAVDVGEDVVSNIAGQGFENIAAGKAWNEDLGTAAVVGAGAGQAVRGSIGAFQKAIGVPMNDGGKSVLDGVDELRRKKITPSSGFVDNAYGYENLRKEQMDKLSTMSIDDPAYQTTIDTIANMGAKDGGDAALLQAMSVLGKNNARIVAGDLNIEVSRGLDHESEKVNLGKELGYSDKELVKSSETVPNAQRQTIFADRNKEIKEGLTKETHLANLQQDINKIHNSMRDNLVENNIAIVQRQIDEVSRSPDATPTMIRELNNYVTDLQSYGKLLQDLLSSKKTSHPSTVEGLSHRLIADGQRLGLGNLLTGIDGKAGTFDPAVNYMAVRNVDQVLEKAYPRASIRSPNVAGEALPTSSSAKGVGATLIGAVTGGVPGAILAGGVARAGGKISTALGARSSQKALRKTKESAKQRIDALLATPNVTAKEAGSASKVELEDAGINTGTLGETSTGMNPPSATPEVAPTQKEAPVPTEAPVSVSEKPKVKRVPLGRKKPEVAQKASEGVTEAQPTKTVVPAAKPEPSAKVERTRKRKEESEARKAKREAEAKAREKVDIVEQMEANEKAMFEAEKAKEARKSNATTIKTPKPKVEKTPEPEVKEPTRKQGSKLRTPPKAVQKPVEAPKVEEVATQPEVVEAAPEATETPSKGGWQRLQEPYTRAVEETRHTAMAPTTSVAKHRKAQETLKEVTSIVDNIHSQLKLDRDVVSDHIETLGGFEHLRQENLDQGHKASNLRKYITDRVRELEAERANKVAKEIISNITTPEAPTKTAAQTQKEVDKAQAARDKAVDEYNKAVKLLEAGEYPQDIIDAAKAFAGGDKDLLNARAKKLMKDRVEEKNAAKKQAEKDLSKAEREKARTDAEDARKQAAKEKADAEVADVSDLLELEGHKQSDIAEAVARFPGNARAVQRAVLARTAARKKAEAAKAEEAAKKAEQAEQAAQAEQDKFTSRENVESYLEGQMVSDPEITTMLNRVFGHPSATHKPTPTVAQVNKLLNDIDAYLAREKAAYEKVHRDDPKQAKADNDRLFAIGNTQTNISNRVVPDDAGLKQAQTEARIAKEQRNKLVAEQKIADQQYKNAKEINDQVKDFREYLEAIGADDAYVAKMLEKHFSGRNAFKGAKPMSDVQYRKARLDAKAEVEAKVEAVVNKEAPKVKSQLEGQSDEALNKAVEALLEISASRKNATEFKAVVEGIKEEMESRGMDKEAKLLQATQDIMDKITEAKGEYPGTENQSLWLSADDIVRLQGMFNEKTGNAWMGNLGVQLRLFAFGDRNIIPNLSDKAIKERKAEIQQERFEKSELSDNGEIKMTKPKDEGNGPDDEGPKPPSGPKGGKPGVAPKPKSEAKTAPVVEATPSKAPKGALESPNNIAELEKQYTPIYNKKFKKSVDDAVSELEEISKWAKESGNAEALEDVNRGLGSLVDNATDNQTDFAKSNRTVTQEEYNETMTSVYNQGLEDAGIAIDKWKPVMDAEKAPEGPSEPVGALSGATEGKGSSKASEAAVEPPTKPEAPKGILELPEDVKVTEKTPEKKLKDISAEKRLNLYKLAKTRMGHTQAEVDKFISDNPNLTAAEVQELLKGKTLFPETKEEAVTRAKKEGYSDEEIMDGLHKRVGDMSEDEIQSLKEWAEREEFPRGELEVIIRKKPMMTKRDVIKSQKELRDFSLRELSTKRLFTSSQYDPTLGSLSEKQRKEGIKRIEQFRGKPLDKDVKKIILETKLHRGKDAINKTPRQYLGDHLTTGEFNIFMNTAYSNRKTRK